MRHDFQLWGTKKRLTEWGNWCYQITTMGLGYSRQSLLAKLQAEGGVIIQGTAKMLVPTNEEAEEVDQLLETLAKQKPFGEGKPELAKVIRIHCTMRDKDNKTRAMTAALTERSYYRYLHDAESWLSHHLC